MYYRCFIIGPIVSVVGKQVDEIHVLLLYFTNTHCLPKLLYAFEVWPVEAITRKKLSSIEVGPTALA